MDINQFLTPESIATILMGADVFTGALSNQVVARASVVLTIAEKVLGAISAISAGGVGLIRQIQDFGGKVVVNVEGKNGKDTEKEDGKTETDKQP